MDEAEMIKARLLRDAPFVFSDYANAARGTPCYYARVLVLAGLMRGEYVLGPIPQENFTRYSLTKVGEDALAALPDPPTC